MRAVVIIPARYASSRFPGKPLVNLAGKPMLLWVCQAAAKAMGDDNVYVATDDDRISQIAVAAGFQALLTSSTALTGTDRVAEAADQVDADLFVNVQGDEPLVDPGDIRKVLQTKQESPDSVINAYCNLAEHEDPASPNLPKVVINESGRMLYMSRAAIPGSKSGMLPPQEYQKQVCIYAFSKEELRSFVRFGRKGQLEEVEDIEILRFQDLGITVQMVRTSGGTLAVDVPEDVAPVERALRNLHGL